MSSDQVRFNLWIPTRSGLELIPNQTKALTEYTPVELAEFACSIVITQDSVNRYAGVKHLRLWEVLALHCSLDPVQLQLNRRGRLHDLKKVHLSLHSEHQNLTNFLFKLVQVMKDAISSKLKCVLNHNDPMQSFVSIEAFKTYVYENRLFVDIPAQIRAESEDVLDKDLKARKRRFIEAKKFEREKELPQHIQDQMHIVECWGSFMAGKTSKIPDDYVYFKQKGYSDKLSTSMCTLNRPANAPKGRIPKRYR